MSRPIPFGAVPGTRLSRRAMLAAALCGAAVAPARAQQGYPSRPVRILVPWAPGGAVDTLARLFARSLSEELRQSFVVENRPGATGTIGAAEVARSAPDGQTLLAIDNTYPTLPILFRNLPFDHANAFAPITAFAISPVLIAVGAHTPYRTLGELIAAARKDPETITYGSGGVGSALHFSVEAFQQAAGIRLYHVPYKGGGEAVTAAMAGQVDVVMPSLGSGLGGIRSGMLRPLALSGRGHPVSVPDLPSFDEAGLPGFNVINWSGLAAPRGTPAPIVGRLREAVVAALAKPDVAEFLRTLAAEPGGMAPAEFAGLMQEEEQRWRRIAEQVGISP
ncbi:tripartite tricarboxylate transporter substrate binding protein [Roseomonas sp. NAR14]|uniref:Tripartite tricarboxylate transporter substrate binding protein n=1 Tax=Roseomonas acroporae TaxID=2937791 RepID=A0A9X1YAX1_9PROT|nr:tripartite tricarboxylate transporter substrate binding protein [Roseomonas acroporae]MCK8786068.1 tripartite tricarboxylate transporter substrate binding protein [Roseomonas acroporae]